MGVLKDARLESLLDSLHSKSDAQLSEMSAYYQARDAQTTPPGGEEAARVKQFLSNKFVALDRDKAEFCYQLCRAIDARRVVEIGTSFGISTLYLAAAVRDNLRGSSDRGTVIATEYEPTKAAVALKHFDDAGLASLIELRQGDLRETLKSIVGPIDFMLMDIWIPMSRPALELVAPHLRPGSVVICDNTAKYRERYKDYFSFIEDPRNAFRTVTLPFDNGLEFSIRE